MNADSFKASMHRIVAVFSMQPDQAAAYLNSIFEAVSWMDPYFFDEACKGIVRGFKVGARKPMPTEFMAAFNAAKQRANVPGQVPSSRCTKCDGSGYEYAFFRHDDGRAIEGVVPCGNCRQADKNAWPFKKGLTPITLEQYDVACGSKSFHTKWAEAVKQAAEGVA